MTENEVYVVGRLRVANREYRKLVSGWAHVLFNKVNESDQYRPYC